MILMLARFLLALFCFSFANSSKASVVRHSLFSNESMFTKMTQGACGGYVLQPDPHWCNPSLFHLNTEPKIKGDLLLNADQDAYQNINRLLYKKWDREFIDELFKDRSFDSFSILTRLEAIGGLVSFSYVPVHFVGAYKLSNPSLPEVVAVGMKQGLFRLTSSFTVFSVNTWNLEAGGSVYLFDRKRYFIQANALELIVKDSDQLVEVSNKKGVNSDAAVTFWQDSEYRPTLAIMIEDAFAEQDANVGSESIVSLDPMVKRRSRLELGATRHLELGHFYTGFKLPYWGFFREFDYNATSASLLYGISRLRIISSYSPLQTTFGFLFMSSNYHLGIQYTDEKQDNALQLRRRKNANIFVSFSF